MLGAQILARAGYDPREMANMFKTIEAEGGGGGPEWLSSHPEPGQPLQRHHEGGGDAARRGQSETGEFPSIQARCATCRRRTPPSKSPRRQARRRATRRPPGPPAAPIEVDPRRRHSTERRRRQLSPRRCPVELASVRRQNTRDLCPGGRILPEQTAERRSRTACKSASTQGTGNLQRDTEGAGAGLFAQQPGAALVRATAGATSSSGRRR